MVYTREILHLAVEMGEAMLLNGAEIYRVDDTISHILRAYDVEGCNVYVLSNAVFASADEGKEDMCSIVRNVPSRTVNLSRIVALNQLSREICSHDCSIMEAWERLEECKQIPEYSEGKQMIACGLGCAGFCWLSGGLILEAVITFFVGILLRKMILLAQAHGISMMMINIAGSFMITAGSLLMVRLGLPVLQDKIVIGGIMALVPGITFTTSIRDFLNADHLSGVIHMIDALLTSVEIAVGVGAVFAVCSMW